MRKLYFSAAAFAALVSGCATTKVGGGTGITRVDATELPAPGQLDVAQNVQDYYIGPLDELTIDVFGIENMMNRAVQVDVSGRIAFPLAGTIDAAGKTPGELSSLIEGRLRSSYVRNPRVTVNLTKTMSQLVTVEGEVKEPGVYPILGKTTLLKAVASAKGPTEFSKLSKIVVLRTVGDQSYAALYDLRAIRDGRYPDPRVFSGDIVVVGESRARRIFRDLLQVAPLLSTPLIVALQNNN